jgi:cephalosporin-C deacetylase-like acetyl esterase
MPDEAGGKGMNVDFKDVWNAVTDVATLLESNTTYAMGTRAFVVPKGLQPLDLEWSSQQEHRIGDRRLWSSWCSRNLWCDATDIRIGVIWSFGGRYQGKGRYLHDAYMWAVADSTAVGVSVSGSGQFSDTPVTVGNAVAVLQGSIHVVRRRAGSSSDFFWDFTIQGDGAGEIRPR